MSCIGVLYKSKTKNIPNPEDLVMVDFHVNYWKLPKKFNGYNRFLDLGVLVYNAKDIESVLFYVPFKITDNNLSDIGDILVKDDLLSLLFNEPYVVENEPHSPCYYYASAANQNENRQGFWIYSLTKTNFKVTNMSAGSLIEVAIKTKPASKGGIRNTEDSRDNFNLYIRFRIEKVQKNSLSYIESISNDFFQSVFSKTEMMNLHINTISEINEDDYKNVASKYSFVNFYKIHFFFVASSEEETVSGAINYSDSRLLDSPKWRRYIGNNNPQQRRCLAYHWKLTDSQNRGNVFFRTVYSSANILKIIKYSIIVILLGVIASYLASFLSCGCK